MSIVGSSVKPQTDMGELAAHLRAKRESEDAHLARIEAERARLRASVPERDATEMIAAVVVELNRQLNPLLELSKRQDLDDEDLDRMIRISAAAIAINRALLGSGAVDPSELSDEELRKAAKK